MILTRPLAKRYILTEKGKKDLHHALQILEEHSSIKAKDSFES